MLRGLGSALQPVMGGVSWMLTPIKSNPKAVIAPKNVEMPTDTALAEIDAIVQRLDSKKGTWAATTAAERAKLFRQCVATTVAVSEEAAKMATDAKGSWHNGIAEEHLSWVPIVTGLREYAQSLEAGGQPAPHAIITRPDGQLVADVMPLGLEAMLFGGWRGEVWIQPGMPATQGKLYTAKAQGNGGTGGVGLVLGAGNQVPVVALDIAHKLLVDDQVVICKMNPVNAWAGPYIRRAFQPLVDAGFVEIVYGGSEQGKQLCEHPGVASIHLTGSAATYNAIVWGDNIEKVGESTLKKEVTGELGCVTPYIVVPGEWSTSDLEYHAGAIATGKSHNAGHNCLAAEIIITAADWPQRQQFIDILRLKLNELPARTPNYPGSETRFSTFEKRFPDAESHGSTTAAVVGAQPIRLQTGLSPETAELDLEHWCGVLQEVAIPSTGTDAAAFLQKSVDLANNSCYGTLSCSIFIPPQVRSSQPEAVDAAIAALRYGSVCVNSPTIMGFCLTKTTWGAFPGGTPQDIGSGNCTVHNTLLFDHPQKSVVWAPWRYHPVPFWSPYNRNAAKVVPAAIKFLASPTLLGVCPVAIAALQG